MTLRQMFAATLIFAIGVSVGMVGRSIRDDDPVQAACESVVDIANKFSAEGAEVFIYKPTLTGYEKSLALSYFAGSTSSNERAKVTLPKIDCDSK